MHPATVFLLGFAAGSVPLSILIAAYYFRARRRVDKIKAAIRTYQDAQASVQQACDKVFSKRG